jgi:molybdopterin converting factor small subunit
MSSSTMLILFSARAPAPPAFAHRIGTLSGRDEWYRRAMTSAGEHISVKLFAGLELRARERRTAYEIALSDAPTVAAVTLALGLAPGAAGLVLVNGLHATAERELAPGDEVSLFPPLGGG